MSNTQTTIPEEELNENSIDLNDPRLTGVNTERDAEIADSNSLYDGMVEDGADHFSAMSDAVGAWGEEQKAIQQERTDFEVKKIQQQKGEAEKDYQKEQSAAYADYTKQTAKHGVNAEQMAANGMAGTGFSESSQVAMYNEYQSRVAVARETIQNAYVAYDNAMTEARLSGDAAMAEIAFNTLSQQLEIAMQGFQYKNDLLLQKASAAREIGGRYDAKWNNVYAQLQDERDYKDSVKRYEDSKAQTAADNFTVLSELAKSGSYTADDIAAMAGQYGISDESLISNLRTSAQTAYDNAAAARTKSEGDEYAENYDYVMKLAKSGSYTADEIKKIAEKYGIKENELEGISSAAQTAYDEASTYNIDKDDQPQGEANNATGNRYTDQLNIYRSQLDRNTSTDDIILNKIHEISTKNGKMADTLFNEMYGGFDRENLTEVFKKFKVTNVVGLLDLVDKGTLRVEQKDDGTILLTWKG